MRGIIGSSLLYITLVLTALNVVVKTEEVVNTKVVSEILGNSNDNQYSEFDNVDVDVFSSRNDVVDKVHIEIDESEEEKNQEKDVLGSIDESEEEEVMVPTYEGEENELYKDSEEPIKYRNIVVKEEEVMATMADDDNDISNNNEEVMQNDVIENDNSNELMGTEELNDDNDDAEWPTDMTEDDTVQMEAGDDAIEEIIPVEEENVEVTTEELNDDDEEWPTDMPEEDMVQMEAGDDAIEENMPIEEELNDDDEEWPTYMPEEDMEQVTNNAIDEMKSVEIDSDGGMVRDNNIVSSSPASSPLESREDYELYKTKTIEKTKNYKLMTEKIKRVVDRYEELKRRQQAIHDKILKFNKDQLQNFPFPIIHPNTTDIETQYVTKKEMLDKYGNHSWEEGLLNSTISLYAREISQPTCEQQWPNHTDLIQLINTHLTTYNPQFPPQNEQIRILYLNSHTTNTYTPPSTTSSKNIPSYIYHSLHLKASVPSPSIIFSSHPLHPFSCWPLQGTNGAISFQLPKPILFTGMTIMHSPQDVVSAPYHIKLYDDTNNDDILLIDSHFNPSNKYIKHFNVSSSFSDDLDDLDDMFQDEYDNDDNNDIDEQITSTTITSDALQQEFTTEEGGASCSEVTHSCSMPPPTTSSSTTTTTTAATTTVTTEEKKNSEQKPIKKMTLYFDNNWGNSHYTCIYRLIIHGQYLSN